MIYYVISFDWRHNNSMRQVPWFYKTQMMKQTVHVAGSICDGIKVMSSNMPITPNRLVHRSDLKYTWNSTNTFSLKNLCLFFAFFLTSTHFLWISYFQTVNIKPLLRHNGISVGSYICRSTTSFMCLYLFMGQRTLNIYIQTFCRYVIDPHCIYEPSYHA